MSKEKQEVMVIYRCNLCGHLNDTEEAHQGQVMETNKDRVVVRLWCEGSYDKLGVVEYDDDAMESIQDHYETRLNERVDILVQKRVDELAVPPTTLEDAAERSRSVMRKVNGSLSSTKTMQEGMAKYSQSVLNQLNDPVVNPYNATTFMNQILTILKKMRRNY